MKRLLAMVLLICFAFCGCNTAVTPSGDNPPTQEQTTIPPASPTESQTTPTDTTDPSGFVTVYLLEEAVLFDNGYTRFHYDEQYNIDFYTVYDLENNPMHSAYFENKDANGMAANYRIAWAQGGDDPRTLRWYEDGKLKEEQYAPGFSGSQYEYTPNGDVSEKREYYDGLLEIITHYQYDGDVLSAVYGEDGNGNKLFDCQVENGLIVKKTFPDENDNYSYLYTYDEHNNLTASTIVCGDETIPNMQYSYFTVEVDAARARYLQGQQQYLFTVV